MRIQIRHRKKKHYFIVRELRQSRAGGQGAVAGWTTFCFFSPYTSDPFLSTLFSRPFRPSLFHLVTENTPAFIIHKFSPLFDLSYYSHYLTPFVYRTLLLSPTVFVFLHKTRLMNITLLTTRLHIDTGASF